MYVCIHGVCGRASWTLGGSWPRNVKKSSTQGVKNQPHHTPSYPTNVHIITTSFPKQTLGEHQGLTCTSSGLPDVRTSWASHPSCLDHPGLPSHCGGRSLDLGDWARHGSTKPTVPGHLGSTESGRCVKKLSLLNYSDHH